MIFITMKSIAAPFNAFILCSYHTIFSNFCAIHFYCPFLQASSLTAGRIPFYSMYFPIINV